MQNIPSKIDQILKVSVKFQSEEFQVASQSLTDLRHFYSGFTSFLQQYSQFLNDQSTGNPLKILSLLIYNAQLMESAIKQIETSTPKNFASVFGSNVEKILILIIAKYSEHITNMRVALEIFRENFKSILESDTSDITMETLDAELDEQAITDTLIAFQEITVASKQMISIITGMTQITQALDGTSAALAKARDSTLSSISLMTFTLNIEIQSARFMFSDQVRSNIQTIVESFGNYSKTSLQVFANTTAPDFLNFVQTQQMTIDDFGTKMGELLVRTQGEFSKRLQDYYAELYQIIQHVQATLAINVQELSNYLAKLVIENNGASFKNCFTSSNGDDDVRLQAIAMIQQMQTDFIACVTTERTLSQQLQGLLTFIVQDVTLNIQGAADRLCGCSVKGGKKVLDETKKCIQKVNFEKKKKIKRLIVFN